MHEAAIDSEPERILGMLTDPKAANRWSPVDFEYDGARGRLTEGSTVELSGKVAGVFVKFEVTVHRADETTLALTATGPVNMDVVYTIVPTGAGSQLSATISISRGRGLTSAVLAKAADAVMAAGALQAAVGRIAREVETA